MAAYIIQGKKAIARVNNSHKAGDCQVCFDWTYESINSNFDYIGINKRDAKVSHAEKWRKETEFTWLPEAVILDKYFHRLFLILDDDVVAPWETETEL